MASKTMYEMCLNMRVLCVILFGVVAVPAQSYYYTTGPYDSYDFDVYDDSFTYTTDKPSTERHPVERNCPSGISQFSEHDIRATIDGIMQCSKIADQVESSVEKYADMQHVYRDDLQNFIKSIEYRPLQLERILEMIALTRKQLEPAVHAFSIALNKTSMYEVKFETIQQEINMTLEKLDRYSRLCELSGCVDRPKAIMENSKGFKLQTRNGKQNRYMCISMTDLKNYINEKLDTFIHEHNNTVVEKLRDYKLKYETEIQNVKRGLKDRALAAFGRTMFDILLLQDEFYNFNVTMSLDAGLMTHQILTNILELQWKLSVLDNKVESYGSRCGRCRKQILRDEPQPIQMRSNTKWTGVQLIDELLDEKLDDLKKHVKSEQRHVLQELDDKLREAESTEVLEKHVELQAKIQDMIAAEQLALNELIKMAPYDKITSMEQLLYSTQLSLGYIDEKMQKL